MIDNITRGQAWKARGRKSSTTREGATRRKREPRNQRGKGSPAPFQAGFRRGFQAGHGQS